MKTTLDLPDELVREVKLRAVHEGKKLKDLTAEILRRGLSVSAPTTPVRHSAQLPIVPSLQEASYIRRRVLPVIQATGQTITQAEIDDALDD